VKYMELLMNSVQTTRSGKSGFTYHVLLSKGN